MKTVLLDDFERIVSIRDLILHQKYLPLSAFPELLDPNEIVTLEDARSCLRGKKASDGRCRW